MESLGKWLRDPRAAGDPEEMERKSRLLLRKVMDHYDLNREQRYAVAIWGRKLYKRHIAVATRQKPPRGSGLILLGQGGSGKTFTDKPIYHMADLLGRQNWFRAASLTGKAAAQMPGLSGTLHEVLMLNIENTGKKGKGKKPGQKEHYMACVDRNIHKLREELQDCWFFVLDEMGMVGQLLLSILDYAFKKIRAADYPGIDIGFMIQRRGEQREIARRQMIQQTRFFQQIAQDESARVVVRGCPCLEAPTSRLAATFTSYHLWGPSHWPVQALQSKQNHSPWFRAVFFG
ncbi:hypothetical protein DFJ74DRAFT_759480 [Hyaloraphidium curvatum]|nr:hypothetical protein DFJ74DRAFT_759480 [Hyaloraphidium curvatum]